MQWLWLLLEAGFMHLTFSLFHFFPSLPRVPHCVYIVCLTTGQADLFICIQVTVYFPLGVQLGSNRKQTKNSFSGAERLTVKILIKEYNKDAYFAFISCKPGITLSFWVTVNSSTSTAKQIATPSQRTNHFTNQDFAKSFSGYQADHPIPLPYISSFPD